MVYKILVVDDESTMRRLTSVLLKRHGHKVIEAADGESALVTAVQQRPDIILLDVMMPITDGFETLRRLRAHPDTQAIPVIFISAKSQVEDRVEGLRLGADDYIVKPADPAELMVRIEAVMNRFQRTVRQPQANIYAFMGAKGGVGTTTALANIGVHLQQAGVQTLLVDLHLAFGNLADHFDLSPIHNSTAHLATIAAEAITESALKRHSLLHPSGLSILASSPTVPQGITFTPEHLTAIVAQSMHCAQRVLLDLPTDPDIIEAIASYLTGITLVVSNDLASLRAAENIARYLNYLNLYNCLSTLLICRNQLEQQFVTEGLVTERLACPCLGTITAKPASYSRAEQHRSPLLLHGYDASDRSTYARICDTMFDRANSQQNNPPRRASETGDRF